MRTNQAIAILTFLLFSVCVPSELMAQDYLDIITVSGRLGSPTPYSATEEEKVREEGLQVSLVAPIRLKEGRIWYNDVNYFGWNIDGNVEVDPGLANPINLHGIMARTGLIQPLSRDRYFQVMIAPRLMSDFKYVDADHFQLGGMATFGKQYKENLKLGFGALFNQEFFGPYLVPLIQVNWRFHEKWSLDGMFPVFGKLRYLAHENFEFGWSHFGLITTYRLGEEAYRGDYIERSSIDESIYARLRLWKDFFLEGRAGYAIGRYYNQYDKDDKVSFSLPLVNFGDDRIAKNEVLSDGFIASLRLVYSVSLKQENDEKP